MAVRSYVTHGQAISMNDLYDKVIDFLANAAGWTLDTDLGLRDKVYSVDGIGASQPTIYVRLTANGLAGGLQTRYGPAQMFSARGYVDYATNRFPFGVIGPEVHINAGPAPSATSIFDISGGPGNTSFHVSTAAEADVDYYAGSYTPADNSRAERYVVHIRSSVVTVYDKITGKNLNKTTPPYAASSDVQVRVIQSSGADVVYYYTTSSLVGKRFYMYDIRTDTHTAMADPPWTATTQTYGLLAFDGADTIYALRGQSSTEFAKYSISSNIWTSLAATPVARSTSRSQLSPIYVPKASSGLAEDRLYVAINPSATNGWYYYIVDGASANTWVQAAALPTTYANGYGILTYDGADTVYGLGTSSLSADQYSITGNTWTSQGNVIPATSSVYHSFSQTVHRYAAELQGPTSGLIDWWASGDRDSVRIVTREVFPDATEKYRTMYLGYYNTKFSSTQFAVSSGVTPGDGVVINMAADPTTEINVGSSWTVVDPDTGVTESLDIIATSANTVTAQGVNNTFGVNSFISQDPYPFVLSDGHFACPVFGAAGYRADGRPDFMLVHASADSVIDRVANTSVRASMPMKEAVIFNSDTGFPSSADVFGSLKGFYYLAYSGAFPGPGMEVDLAGGTILVVDPYGLNVSGTDSRRFGVLLA